MAERPEPGARLTDEAVHQRLTRIEELLERVEQVPGPTSDAAIEAVQLVTEIYGEALARTVGRIGPTAVRRCAEDELIAHLMVLHELHPDPVEQRVTALLDRVRPALEANGGGIELLAIDEDVVRVRLSTGGCGSCASGDPGFDAFTETLLAIAPELSAVENVPGPAGSSQALIPVEALLRRPVGV
jgi:Fe-S cluster biogenesis protein NfuA